jgi:peptidoglycan lytic transglycosylase G
MSNLGLQMSSDSRPPEGPRHRGRSWIAILLSLGVLALIGFGVKFAIENIPDLGGPADYAGEGTDPVEVKVEDGQTLTEIGRTLKALGVVASVDAWLDAANKEPKAKLIGPGVYDMRTEMSAQAAVDRMVDPDTRITDKLLLREGLRFTQSIEAISKATGISKKKLVAASEGGRIGLPKYAEDNAEGFLFPATYELEKGESATDILTRLVARWEESATTLGLDAGAAERGVTPYEAMIIASLVQAEGHPDDFDKVARVIYNRLDEATWGGTYGYLQMDATINYALGKSDINLTTEELQNTDSPYNTYKNPGLPPTPINSPGEAAIDAALNPADGPWLYYVTVNPDTGETKFTDNYDEFLGFKSELSDWLAANPQ